MIQVLTRRQVELNDGNSCTVGLASRNCAMPVLMERSILKGESQLGWGGTVLTYTGKHTGRSPKDKLTVNSSSRVEQDVFWGNNQPLDKDQYASFKSDFFAALSETEVFIQDVFACRDTNHQVKVRFINGLAWHSAFVQNMFIMPPHNELERFVPDWVVINLPEFKANPQNHGTMSETAIVMHLEERMVLICNTNYAGENKKSVFSFLNYSLPRKNVLTMHCSANHAHDDPSDSALFFGLSGTGKTTLSTDPNRTIVGDDEHGWSNDGIFNIEGGIYAKTHGLNPIDEPEIYGTTSMFGTVIENAVYDPISKEIDFEDVSVSENSRCAFSIEKIPNVSPTGTAGHPRNIFFLTCDAFGVLPPISCLTPAQAMYHFLSGFTAKVAGTEQGIKEPQPSFSTCFGKPFLPLSPVVYGNLFRDKIRRHGSKCWLINTGWTGGGYGTGKRISIKLTRALLTAALSGKLGNAEFCIDPNFGLRIPLSVGGIPAQMLNPREAWKDRMAYDRAAHELVEKFRDNFKQFESLVDEGVRQEMI